MSGEHSRSKTSAIIAMYDVSTTRIFVRYKTVSDYKVHLLCLTTFIQLSQCEYMLRGGSVWLKTILLGSEVGIQIADPTWNSSILQG